MKLFEPFHLGKLALKNRIVMPPIEVNYGTDEGFVTDRARAYYEARAAGGVGLIIVEGTSIDLTRTRCRVKQLAIDNDKFIPAMKGLTDAVHKRGAKIALQLQHAGSMSSKDLTPLPPVTATAMAGKDGSLCQELASGDMPGIAALFAAAAKRAQKAGFDGVEIQGAHGYLIVQFLSAARNKRKDAYGGELRNRARLLIEVIAAMREAVGPDFPIWSRLNAEEGGMPGGITIRETVELVRMLEGTTLDAVSISGLPATRTIESPPGYFVEFAAQIKKSTRLPVMVAGMIDPELGEKVLQQGRADLILIGRPLIADPDLPRKVLEGRAGEIRACLRDNYCRDEVVNRDRPMRCKVNTGAGREWEAGAKTVPKRKS